MEDKKTKNRILVVDDAPENIWILVEALKDEYAIMVAKNGYSCLRLAEGEHPPDAILLDVTMPGIDGYEVCRCLKANAATRNIPVLFITGQIDAGSEAKGLELGAMDYITKPFGIGELRARVAAHLRRETREKKQAVSVGGVQFLLKAKKVRYKDEELDFTKSEYAICEYLALNHGQVFSKEQIYEHVFGYEKESDNSVITEHIKNIRAKCQKAGLEPIETVWGIGYRWRQG